MPFASHPIWFFNTIFTCTIFSQIVQSNVQLPIITMVEIFSLFEMKIWNLTSLINHFLCKIFSVFVLYALLMMNIQVYSVTLILYIHFKGRFSFLLMNIFSRKLLISWKIDLNHQCRQSYLSLLMFSIFQNICFLLVLNVKLVDLFQGKSIVM